MTFKPLIPQPAHYLSQSQKDLLLNNGQLNIVEGVNHVSFDNAIPANSLAAERGKHHMVELLNRDTSGSAPPYAIVDPAGTITEMVFYAKNRAYANLGITETTAYLRKANGNLFQITGVDPVINSPGQTFLPGGIVLKWGGPVAIVSGVGGTTIDFTALPIGRFESTCLNVQLTSSDNNAHFATVQTYSPTGFKARSDNAINVFWLAIGY